MSLIESCQSLGIDVTPEATIQEIIDILKTQADDLKVKLLLGIAYQEEEQEEEAFKVFEEAAAQGSLSALYQKAAYLYDGRGVEKNTKIAIDLMEEVIELAQKDEKQEHLLQNAYLNLGRAYWDAFPHNAAKAEEYWTKAAAEGNGLLDAMIELSKLYAHPVYKNEEKCFYWHQNAAGAGHVPSQAIIGKFYLEGKGIGQSTTKAMNCFKRSAFNGSALGRAMLAELYYKRKMFTEAAQQSKRVCDTADSDYDFSEKDEHYRKGFCLGAFIYSRCLQLGRGTLADYDYSVELLHAAASADAEYANQLQREIIAGQI